MAEPIEFKKVAVLASNSFTGAHMVDYLLEHTDAEILGISRSDEYKDIFLPYAYKKERSKRFTFHKLDVNKDFEAIKELFDEFEPEVVLNYAAQGEVRNSWKWPEQWYQTNALGVVRIANFLKDKKYLKKYLNCSTPEVYGTTGTQIKENKNFFPSTPYAASKLSGELFLYALLKKQNFPFVSTRSANVYGIHQQLFRIIPRTIIYFKLGKKLQLHGGGKTVRSFIHIRDVSDATLKAIRVGENGEAFHVAPDNEDVSIRELVEMICDMMGYKFEDCVELIDENFGQDATYSLSIEKAKKELNWEPKTKLKEGIQEMITWIEDNWDVIKNEPLDYVHKE